MRKNLGKLTATLVLVALMLALAATAILPSTSASATGTRTAHHSGMFGITLTQTARVNVVNVSQVNLPVVLRLVDSEGKELFGFSGVIGPQKTASISLNGNKLLSNPTDRIELRAVVKLGPNADPSYLNRLISSVEVFDNDTGKTIVMPEIR